MNEHSIHSDEEAALIDAHIHASALAQRYGHACDVLLEPGELRDRLDARRKALETTCGELESRIRERGLLPHDINVDREDLARLADRFREWLDHERHSHLQRALADRESELIEQFEALQEAGIDDATIDKAESDARWMVKSLVGHAAN